MKKEYKKEEPQEKTRYLCQVLNATQGTTKNGNPYIKVGLKVKTGDRNGTWINHFVTITDRSKEFARRDLTTLGVDTETMTVDKRHVTAVYGWSDKMERNQVLGIYPAEAPTKSEQDETEYPF